LNIKYLQEQTEAVFSEIGLLDCFWLDGKIQGQKLEIFIDRDGGISFDACQKVSRALEAIFDESQIFGDSYILEVSSPGVGSPLKFERQYKNNIGRNIEVKTSENVFTGTLVAASEGIISVACEEIVKEGNKKIKNKIVKDILLSDIKVASIKISFK
jgi:ribosome maturation factor RimP